MSSATRLIAVVLLAALGMGGPFFGARAGAPVPLVAPDAATASQPPDDEQVRQMLPDELPADLPGGTIDTPLGKARWVHLTGDATTLPDPLQPTVGPEGLIWFDWGGSRQIMPCGGSAGGEPCMIAVPPTLSTSDDAVSARVEHPLPVDAASAGLFLEGDTYWLTTTDPASLWRSSDLVAWDQVDISALESPGPADLAWDVELGAPVTSGGVSLVPVTYRARGEDVARLLGLVGYPGFYAHLENAGPGRYTVSEHHSRSEGGDETAGTVRVEETPTGLRFADEDGATIAELDGVGLDFVETWAARGSIEEHQLGILDGTGLTAVEMPGIPLVDPSSEGPTLFPVDDGFLALQVDSDRTVRTWRSEDGRSWIEGDRLRGPDGEPWKTDWVGADWLWGGHEITVTPLGQPKEPPDYWRSPDGESWTRVPVPSYEDGLVWEVPAGFLRLAENGSWSASRDGESWLDAPELGRVVTKWQPQGAGGAGGGAVGNALFFSVDEAESPMQRDLWIIEFAPRPGE